MAWWGKTGLSEQYKPPAGGFPEVPGMDCVNPLGASPQRQRARTRRIVAAFCERDRAVFPAVALVICAIPMPFDRLRAESMQAIRIDAHRPLTAAMFKLIDCGMQVRLDGGRGLGGNAVLAVLINVEHGRSMRARQAIVKISENSVVGQFE